MRTLVTGSSGHLGEALVRVLRGRGEDVVGLDRLPCAGTTHVGDLTDRDLLREALQGVTAVLHTATLHKPHVGTHPRQAFVDTNVSGTLAVLEEAVAAGVRAVVMTSTTSAYGRALRPAPGEPAVWVTEELRPVPRNVYGVTKTAAEDLCALVAADTGLPVVVLRTSRFFPEPDDDPDARAAHDPVNLQVNELLHRRVDLEDVVAAHLLARERAPGLRWGRYVVSATTPFLPEDAAGLRADAAAVLARRLPEALPLYDALGWRPPATLDRVYDSARARAELGWAPRHDVLTALRRAAAGQDPRSDLAVAVGAKGYHDRPTGPYTA